MRRFASIALALWVLCLLCPNTALAATQFSLDRWNSTCDHYPWNAPYAFGTNFVEGARGSALTTVPAALPLLTFPGRECGSTGSWTTTGGASPAYLPMSLTGPIFTPRGPWCADLTIQSLSSILMDMRNVGTAQFFVSQVGNYSHRIGLGVETEPGWESAIPMAVAPSVWTSFSDMDQTEKIAYAYAGGTGSTKRSGYASLSRIAVLHAFGGSVVTTLTPAVRYWWKASGHFEFASEYAADSVPFSVNVTGSVTPPSIETTTVSDHGPETPYEQVGYTFQAPSGNIYINAQPNFYGASVYVKAEMWDVVGGTSEDSETVAYYSANVDLANTGSLVASFTPSIGTSGSAEPSAPPTYGSTLPTGTAGDSGWFTQFASSFSGSFDALMWPFRAFQGWIR